MNIDNQLLADFNNRDIGAWKRLYELCYPTIVIYIDGFIKYTPMARDIANEVFEKIYRNQKEYENPKHLVKALYKISKNCTMTYFRDRKRTSTNIDEQRLLHLLEQQVEEGGLSAFLKEQFIQFAIQEVEHLPEKQKMAIKLHYLENLPVKEVALRMGVSISTVHTNKDEALKKLREKFAREFFDDTE